MATVRSVDGALDLERRELPLQRFLAGLRTYWTAVCEGSAAARDYEAMVRRGIPHDEAVQRIFKAHFSR